MLGEIVPDILRFSDIDDLQSLPTQRTSHKEDGETRCRQITIPTEDMPRYIKQIDIIADQQSVCMTFMHELLELIPAQRKLLGESW